MSYGERVEMSDLARTNILAHRGSWNDNIPKNSREALSRALLAGFGLETDIRDLDGTLVISHDPPKMSDDVIPFDWLLDFYISNNCSGILALNIKSDGLAAMSEAALRHYGITQYFVFDMSIPDMLAYLRAGMPAYSRVSEYEPKPALAAECSGIWLDNFTGGFPQEAAAVELHGLGKPIAIVSPELHKRPHEAFWSSLRNQAGLDMSSILLCTDFPDEAALFFGSPTL
ncbi:hypothetical protein RMR10_001165 [Agrobacterium rosae]|uniref:hypothetical protein n=1 Tax=Agrobacterium rosae TaxID=1972867 RepID=UPI003D7B6FFA